MRLSRSPSGQGRDLDRGMTQLPRFDPSDVATRSDLRELRAELKGDLAAIHTRLDRMFLALVAGLFAVVAAMLGVVVTSL